MPIEEVKPLYESLKSSGDLLRMYPDLSGDWEKDEAEFTRQHQMNEDMLFSDFDDSDDY